MAVVFLDIDGTLLRGTSCELQLFKAMIEKGIIGPKQLLSYAAFTIRYWAKFGHDIFKKNKAYLNGLRTDEVEIIAARLAKDALPEFFNPRVVERMEAHKMAGDKLILLTGSPDFVISHIATRLGADDFIAARLAARNGRFLGAVPEVHPFGREKVKLAEKYCLDHAYKMSQAVAYADSMDDLPLLEMVGKAVAVTPEKKLERISRIKKWEIIN
ncbi:MAG: HAD-IB family hydrolase [Candidatus Edwardsbacteria bacterium]|nr:HAD-IB family hydrolase [Candidatus Edwardsbacteria bacterium]MBU1577162.1 HAD-IB family hydrolase [Candidatus Edwardsbacteria bacterium]MBU2464424.1 HAD-IB family hydrolase [Candidatus Edwardsbacteria bacterium]MBU2593301.1 HAD-IB family hydrolase [Candidatus Edwardsbacteria bacterium]